MLPDLVESVESIRNFKIRVVEKVEKQVNEKLYDDEKRVDILAEPSTHEWNKKKSRRYWFDWKSRLRRRRFTAGDGVVSSVRSTGNFSQRDGVEGFSCGVSLSNLKFLKPQLQKPVFHSNCQWLFSFSSFTSNTNLRLSFFLCIPFFCCFFNYFFSLHYFSGFWNAQFFSKRRHFFTWFFVYFRRVFFSFCRDLFW